jgi:phage tail sheath protein FI
VTLTSVSIFNPLGANDAARRASIVTALQAEINGNTEVRSEFYEYNLILCPGYHEVVDELVALSNDVLEEALVIADTPVDKTPEQVPTWSLTSARVQSQNAAYYYPWGLASNIDGRNVCVAPSGIAARTYAYSDNQSYIWFAPAGVNRGRVTGVSQVGYVSGTLGTATTFVETNLNLGQRDSLYESFKNINPIVQFPGRGILVWGQKTSSPVTSALDRVNVVRLVMFLRRQLRKGSFPFVFEPNDKVTRDNLKSMADGLLNDVLAKRGLYDFATLCDESNNTPFRIDNNELYLDVAIKPTKAVEFVHIPLRVLSTGDQLG